MPAAGVFALGGGVDLDAATYNVELYEPAEGAAEEDRAALGPFLFAGEVVQRLGKEPSYATVELPLSAFVETAPAVAGGGSAPAGGVRIGMRAVVRLRDGGTALPLLAGLVVNIREDLEADGLVLSVHDDRFLLRGLHVVGRFVHDPKSDTTVYSQRGPCRFNPDGRPNCLDTAYGPLFSPRPAYGREDGDADPAPGAARRAARPWRLSDILEYLRRTLCTDELRDLTAAFPWYRRLDPDRLLVPPGFASALHADAAGFDDDREEAGFQTNDRENADAKAPDLSLEGVHLLAALSRVVESAGAYALYCEPLEERTPGGGRRVRSKLEVVPLRCLGGAGEGVEIVRPAGGELAAFAGAAAVSGGCLEEDGAELYTAVAAAGEPVRVERRLELRENGGGGLAPAWSAEEERLFRDYIDYHPEHPYTREAFWEACWLWPRVFAAFQVEDDYDYTAGTKYADFPRVPFPPALLPDLLSERTEETDGVKRRVRPYPVTVELKDDAGNYHVVTPLDGLETDEDGVFGLPTLREAGLSDPYHSTWKGTYTDPDTLQARELRMTAALEFEHRLTAEVTLSGRGGTGNDDTGDDKASPVADPAGTAGRIAAGLERGYWADAGAYREHLRGDSWPEPESVEDTVKSPDRAAAGAELRSDASAVRAHARRRLAELGRVKNNGRLLFPRALPWKPGTPLSVLRNVGSDLGDRRLNAVVKLVRHRCRENETEIELS